MPKYELYSEIIVESEDIIWVVWVGSTSHATLDSMVNFSLCGTLTVREQRQRAARQLQSGPSPEWAHEMCLCE